MILILDGNLNDDTSLSSLGHIGCSQSESIAFMAKKKTNFRKLRVMNIDIKIFQTNHPSNVLNTKDH